MRKILGLDLGTSSIGWAVVSENEDNSLSTIALGSRIIPTDAATLSKYGSGDTVSQTKERTTFRSTRRLRDRHLLRRQRLFRLLNRIEFLPRHFTSHIDSYGHFINETEPKIAWNASEFIFKSSFEEMLQEFKESNPNLFANNDKKIPYDWTLYYLRKKALNAKISKEELSWIILNFNQKRGYYQLRGEGDEIEVKKSKTRQYFDRGLIVNIEDTKEVWKGKRVLVVELDNGNRGKIFMNDVPSWIGTHRSVIVTVDLDAEGRDKLDENGDISQRFKIPTDQEWEENWPLIKLKTEEDLKESGKSVGCYIYDALLKNPSQKIKGELVRVIERRFYKDELIAILYKQSEYHSELLSESLYNEVVEDLYRSNDGYRASIEGRNMVYLIVENIIFYQRPLKTKRSQISDCKYEYYENHDGEKFRLKAAPKSHPLYQEFRLWKFISHLRIFKEDMDVTDQMLKNELDYTALFDWLVSLKEIDNNTFVKYKGFKIPKAEQCLYRWNYVVEDKKKYPCNETLWMINNRLNKKLLPAIASSQLTNLWHILYSVTDKEEIKKALIKFAEKNNYDTEAFVNVLKGCVFEREYGAYSQKAIKKLLALMRRGAYWGEKNIDQKTRNRIEHIINGEFDNSIDERTRQKCGELVNTHHISDFRGIDEWLASYLIYGRHSEGEDVQIWRNPSEIDQFLKNFKQHSLRNPIVEKIVTETLRVVKDVWQYYGKFDEIHIELAREMKQTADQRKRDTRRITDNENSNYRIRKILEEFQNPEYGVEALRAFSPSHQDIYKIYEEYAFSQDDLPEEIISIRGRFLEKDVKKQPSKAEILKYKLWLEQQYRSPYTGELIPLAKLFTKAYEIEHIIPRALYWDNSLSNKVICESEVNKLKDNRLGLQFIQNDGGARVLIAGKGYVTVYTEAEYLQHIEKYYSNNKRKSNNLKLTEIPDDFTSSQLNNTRYITKFISSQLSNIVREEGEVDSLSKNVIITSGVVTGALKRDWGLSDVWNRIISPRFERLNLLTNSSEFGEWVCQEGKRFFRTSMPLELSKGFTKKRIDHRHHAMDALVIACTTRSHINYLNNLSSDSGNKVTRFQLRSNLCYKHRPDSSGNYEWRFNKPWVSFTQDAYSALDKVVVSFKQNLRVINKATNHYEKFKDGKRVVCTQDGLNWAIRKSLHKDTVAGLVNLQKIESVSVNDAISYYRQIVDKKIRREVTMMISEGVDVKKIAKFLKDKGAKKIEIYIYTNDTSKLYGATRKSLDMTFDKKKIESITDSGIRKILLAHLSENEENSELAFSANGIVQMNLDIKRLNGGKSHKPIKKVRVSEVLGNKFCVGSNGAKSKKFVEADKGTNLFFAIYQNEDGVRSYDSVSLNVVIENQKQGLPSAPTVRDGVPLKYVLSPNDLVYVPLPDQIGVPLSVSDIDISRVYKMVSCTGNNVFFVHYAIASVIVDKLEVGSMNKMEKTMTGEMIKSICVPIKVNRIGQIIQIEQ